ncbi:MAG: hypothetical protein PHY47_14440 [Lachnospiraceae bacterium]|nr:hypothetical protein [Lachnospiraceae bacterium]
MFGDFCKKARISKPQILLFGMICVWNIITLLLYTNTMFEWDKEKHVFGNGLVYILLGFLLAALACKILLSKRKKKVQIVINSTLMLTLAAIIFYNLKITDLCIAAFTVFPFFFCCFVFSFRDMRRTGFIIAQLGMYIFAVIAYLSLSYINIFIVLFSGLFILTLALYKNVFDRKTYALHYILLFFPVLALTIALIILKGERILINFSPAFSEALHKIPQQEYLLSAYIFRYGYISAIVYMLVFIAIVIMCIKLIRETKGNMMYVMNRAILFTLIAQFTGSVIVNMGCPFLKGIPIPFLQVNRMLLINSFQIGIILFSKVYAKENDSEEIKNIEVILIDASKPTSVTGKTLCTI